MHKFLFLKKSTIPNSGKGLFTRRAIANGERIIEYTGRIQTWKEVKETDGHNPYLFYINSKTVINPEKRKSALAKYANDSKGLTRVKGLRKNAEYDVKGTKCFITATRNIREGEEILVAYGPEYWKLIKDELLALVK